MVRRYPAILIGGPPHSGKSSLTYQLGLALRRRVALYILRASPDGEGAWSFESAGDLVRELRARARQGPGWTPEFADLVTRQIAQRHLSLLVDVGGRASPEVEQIAAQCTGAILIASDLELLQPWRALLDRQNVPLLAELRSDLLGAQTLDSAGPPIRGVISGLVPKQPVPGRCFDLLVSELANIYYLEPGALARAHISLTSIEPCINLEAPLGVLPAHRFPEMPWRPSEIPLLLEHLVPAMPLAIYGVAPLWLYAALAAFSYPAPCEVFSTALGWVAPPRLQVGGPMDATRLLWDAVTPKLDYTHIKLSIVPYYLDYADAQDLPVPQVPTDRGVIIDGRMPNWLYAALVRSYASAAWLGVYEPRANPAHAVIIASRTPERVVGSVYQLA